MAGAKILRQLLMREAKDEIHYSIRNRILGMIPEKVRKIVGWILIIFGTVVMLGVWLGSLFFGLIDYEVVSIIAIIVSLGSIFWGIILLRGPRSRWWQSD
jgi:ABC-type antimicrobial peptide transport system permease subunit